MSGRIVVTGGGIGGLAAALALSRLGHEVVVLERNQQFTELGAGIQLAPNGLRALDALGADVGAGARAVASPMRELRFHDGVTGEHVTSLPLTEQYQRRFGRPYVVVHRADLHRLLLQACRAQSSVTLRTGAEVIGYRQDPRSATVLLAGGATVSGAAVIGADGIRSQIRRQLVGDGEPRVSGITVYRTVLPMDEVPDSVRRDAVTWWAGPGCHFVHYPIAGGRFLNLAASNHDGGAEPIAGVPVGDDVVRAALRPLRAARFLLDLGRDWRSWMLVDREPVDRWTDGRVTLLGDAAHPMLHYAAQGACQALEDAVALAGVLGGSEPQQLTTSGNPGGSVPRQLAIYNEIRRERTAAIQRISHDSTRLWHPAGEAARERNRALAALSPTDLHENVAWMHELPALEAHPSGATR